MTALHKPSAIIFDWDDTLVDNWETACKALNAALVHMSMEPWSEEEIRRRSGPTARALFTGLFGEERWEEGLLRRLLRVGETKPAPARQGGSTAAAAGRQ
jgi:phosphoglycolate phosphatase-like HAD superfamily hydrolase